MLRATVLAATVLALLAAQPADPVPLTPEQRARIGPLANGTHRELTRLKALLDERQQVLAAVYGVYELDEQKVAQLENEILDAQRQMLACHRKLQTELRTLVDREWFLRLKKRLDNMLQTPLPKSSPANQNS